MLFVLFHGNKILWLTTNFLWMCCYFCAIQLVNLVKVDLVTVVALWHCHKPTLLFLLYNRGISTVFVWIITVSLVTIDLCTTVKISLSTTWIFDFVGFGDKDVYSKLNPELEKRLPREYTEWRRLVLSLTVKTGQVYNN